MFLFLKRQYVPFLEKNVEVSGVFLESRIEISYGEREKVERKVT